MRLLILYWHPEFMGPMRAAVWQHLHTLDASDANHDILYYNDALNGDDFTPSRQAYFDAVILHNTFLGLRWQPWFYPRKLEYQWLREWNCPKIALPQDEYDHAHLLDEWLFDWGVSIIFTNFDQSKRKLLYPILHDKATFYSCFTGYIDDNIARQYSDKLQPISARPYDIVYRATHLPYWFGRHGQLKHYIANVIGARAQAQGLKCDISTQAQEAILGDQWLDFLASGRSVIGCESGSSVLDRRGEIQARVQSLLHQNPALSFAEVDSQLPAGWDDYQFFAISPRHFEAVITKTCQILIEGNYDGVLEPNRHYLPLKPDFSNLDDILVQLRDHPFIQAMVDCAYEDVYLSRYYTYHYLAEQIERALLEMQPASVKRDLMTEDKSRQNLTDLLERQVIAERHLQAALQETKENLGQLQGHVKAMTAAIEAERAAWQTERLLLSRDRKRLFMLIAVISVVALVSTLVTFLLLVNLGIG